MANGSFDGLTPPKKITDPKGTPVGMYPRHVHKFAGVGKLNDYIVVNSPEDEAKALKDGWSLTPVLTEPKKAKDA